MEGKMHENKNACCGMTRGSNHPVLTKMPSKSSNSTEAGEVDDDSHRHYRDFWGLMTLILMMHVTAAPWIFVFKGAGMYQFSSIMKWNMVLSVMLWCPLMGLHRARGFVTNSELRYTIALFACTILWAAISLHTSMGGWKGSGNILLFFFPCATLMQLFEVPSGIRNGWVCLVMVVFMCDWATESGQIADLIPAEISMFASKIHQLLRAVTPGHQEPGWPGDCPTLQKVVTLSNVLLPMLLSWMALLHVMSKRREWQNKSDSLLYSLLPSEVADKLRRGIPGSQITQREKDVTCFFASLEGYEEMCDNNDPETVLSTLDEIFTAFDHMCEITGACKVETIADCYFAVATLDDDSVSAEESCYRMAVLSLAVRDFMLCKFSKSHELTPRCGLHTGDLVAGVMGIHRPRYVLVGDTVNTAARVQALADPRKVAVSGESAKHLAKYFSLTDRGLCPVKGKGMVRMFELVDLRPEYPDGAFGLKHTPAELANMAAEHLEGESLCPHILRCARKIFATPSYLIL
jgi:class 3 adenylate cyclase